MASTDGKTLKVQFRPGLFRQSTSYAAEGSWYDSDRVRFRNARPENMRGMQIRVDTSIAGTSRAQLIWKDYQGIDNIAFGTEYLLYVNQGGMNYDITPAVTVAHVSGKANTSVGSAAVVVSLANSMTQGTYVAITSMLATIGGNVFLSGLYQTQTVSTASFTINNVSAATATSAACGEFDIALLYPAGTSINGLGYGYGTGTYGTGTYGTSGGSGIVIQMRQWSLDTFGEDLVANPRGGPIYIWYAASGPSVRAQKVSNGPSQNNSILVSPEEQHIISFGGTDIITSVYDPLLVQWAADDDYTQWTPAVTNTAGSLHIGAGTFIVGAVRGKNQVNFWTDQTMHAMTFTGPPFTFSFRQLGSNCGLIGPHAAVVYAGVTYWMSQFNFFKYDGAVADMNCQVQRYIFDNINLEQADKIYAGSNTEFNELIWLYPSKNSNEVDSYVIYDIPDDAWAIGTFSFSSWSDRGPLSNVVAINAADARIYDVEVSGVYTSNGHAMTCFVSSTQFDMADGTEIMFMDRIIPDFEFVGGDNYVQMQVNTVMYPGSQVEVQKGPYTVSAGTTFIPLRARGRQMAVRVFTSNANSGWRSGDHRFNILADGGR